MKCLVTGARSGIGCYLAQMLNADVLNREHKIADLPAYHYDCIIHAAVNQCRQIDSSNIHQVFSDNLLLTKQLTLLKPKLFVYFSSVDVYPMDGHKLFLEDEIFGIDQTIELYGMTKLMGEAIVRSELTQFLILRPGLLLGSAMRPNSVSKIIENKDQANLNLTSTSEFYIVTYDEILRFITLSIESNIYGTFNIFHSPPVNLREIADHYGSHPKWGKFRYLRPLISNSKAIQLLPGLLTPSLEVIKDYYAAAEKKSAP
jgi:nucleoside-diphosphate-sugar epimerase